MKARVIGVILVMGILSVLYLATTDSPMQGSQELNTTTSDDASLRSLRIN